MFLTKAIYNSILFMMQIRNIIIESNAQTLNHHTLKKKNKEKCISVIDNVRKIKKRFFINKKEDTETRKRQFREEKTYIRHYNCESGIYS